MTKQWKFVRVQEELYLEIEGIAVAADISITKLINILLRSKLEEQEKSIDKINQVCYYESIAKAKAAR